MHAASMAISTEPSLNPLTFPLAKQLRQQLHIGALRHPPPEEWQQHNAYAKGMVVLNVKNPIGHGVKTDGTAAEAWKSLTDIQDAVSDIGKINTDTKLRSIHHTDGADLDEHIRALRTAWNRYNTQGGAMTDADFCIIILASMPRQWTTFVTTLYSLKMSMEVVVQLKIHDNILSHNRKTSIPSIQALATPNNASQQSNLTCSNLVCKRIRHTIDKCFKPGGSMEGQYPDWWRKKSGTSTTKMASTPKPTANIAVVQHPTTSGLSEHYVFMMNIKQNNRTLIIYADLATSNHCFMDIKDFTTYQPSTGKDGETAVKGGKFVIARMGRVDKRVVFDGRVITLSLKDAVHTSDLSHNPISIGELETEGGCYSVFGGGGVTFINKDQRPFLQG